MEKMDKVLYLALMNTYTKDRADITLKVKRGELTIEEFKKDVKDFINEFYRGTTADIEKIIRYITENLFGYSVITPLINDPLVTDIHLLDWDRINVKKKGQRSRSDVHFDNEDHYQRFIESVITRNQINASTVNAITRFTDNESVPDFILRFTLVTDYLTSCEKNQLIIRKTRKDFYELQDLINEGMMTPEVCEFLLDSWRESSMIICGKNSSGKTTLLNALKEETPETEAVLILQQAEELTNKRHPDTVLLRTREGRGEADTTYTLEDLTIAGLTLDVDRVIIGETKDAEAMYLLNASDTGLKCATTVHSAKSTEALDKVIDYALYRAKYSKHDLEKLFGRNFKTIVHVHNFKIQDISVVKGVDDSGVLFDVVYERGKIDKISKLATGKYSNIFGAASNNTGEVKTEAADSEEKEFKVFPSGDFADALATSKKMDFSLSVTPESAPESTPEKPKRGRPRKNPVVPKVVKEVQTPNVEPPKKKRGRPKKNATPAEPVSVKNTKDASEGEELLAKEVAAIMDETRDTALPVNETEAEAEEKAAKWLESNVQTRPVISSKEIKRKVIEYMVENKDDENIVIASEFKIAKDIGADNISEVLDELMEEGFCRKQGRTFVVL